MYFFIKPKAIVLLSLALAPLTCLGEIKPSIETTTQNKAEEVVVTSSDYFEMKSVPAPSKEELKEIPQNLARWYTGASLYLADPVNGLVRWDYNEARKDAKKYALLSDDPSVIHKMNKGHHTFIVDLGGFYVLKTFHMQNYTARGTLVVYTANVMHSPDSPQWKLVGKPTLFKPEQVARTSLGIAEGRYVKINFYMQKEGEVGPFHVSGSTPLSLRTIKTGQDTGESETELVPFNIASLNTGSRVSMINAGNPKDANSILDEDPDTAYNIPPSDKPSYVLIDLQEYHNVHRVALDIEGDPGLLNFYLFDAPPDFAKEELAEENQSTEAIQSSEKTQSAPISYNYLTPLVLLAAEGDTLGESLAIGQALNEQKQEQNAFQRLANNREPDFVGSATGEDTQVKFDFTPRRARFVLIEWIQEGSTGPNDPKKGLTIREVAVMSEIPAPEFVQQPGEEFSFAAGEGGDPPTQPPLYTPPPIPPIPKTPIPPSPPPPIPEIPTPPTVSP